MFKCTAVHPDVDISFTCAALNVSELKPSMLANVLHAILIELHNVGMGVCVIVGDGAGENAKLFSAISTEYAATYLTPELQEKLKAMKCDLFKCVMLHPITGEPIVVIEDMPHLIKRLVNALELSSNPKSFRNLFMNKSPLNLGMIKKVWEAVGGKTYQLQGTKLTMSHFIKGANSRMIVSLAMQVLSMSVAMLLKTASTDDDIDLPMHSSMYEPMIQLCEHVNELVDIVNGRSSEKGEYTANFTRMKAESIQSCFLKILDWFAKWKDCVAASDKDAKEKESNFLADATWVGLQRMILGYVVLIETCCCKKGYTINPRCTTSDPCENHFAGLRCGGGSNTNSHAKDNDSLTIKSNLYNNAQAEIKCTTKENNADFPGTSRRPRF